MLVDASGRDYRTVQRRLLLYFQTYGRDHELLAGGVGDVCADTLAQNEGLEELTPPAQ